METSFIRSAEHYYVPVKLRSKSASKNITKLFLICSQVIYWSIL